MSGIGLRSISSSTIKFENQADTKGTSRSLPYVIDAIKSELGAKGIDLDKLEGGLSSSALASRDHDRVQRLVDLRDYKILEKVLLDLKDDDALNLTKRCFLTCQPELKHDLIWHDPSIPDGRRNKICRKYNATDKKKKYTEELDLLRKQQSPFDGHQFTLFHNKIKMLEKIIRGEADEDDFDEEFKLREFVTNYTETVYDSHGNLVISGSGSGGGDQPNVKIKPSSSVETLASPRSDNNNENKNDNDNNNNNDSNINPKKRKDTPPPPPMRAVQSKRKNKSNSQHRHHPKRPSLRSKRSSNARNNRGTNNDNARGSDYIRSPAIITSYPQPQYAVNEELPERWKNWQQFYDTQQQHDNNNNARQHHNHNHRPQHHPASESGGDTTARTYGENQQQQQRTRASSHHQHPATADESAMNDDVDVEEIRTDVNHIPSMATKLEGEEREQYVQELMARHREEASKSYGQSLMASAKNGTRNRATESSRHYTKHLREHAILMVPPPVREGDPPVKTRVRRKIMEGSYPNWSVNEEGLDSVLRYAWKGKLKKLERYLRDKKRHEYINIEDSSGRTALHYGASWGCIRTIKTLMNIPDIQLNMRDEHGKTPLFKAVEINSIESVEHLMNSGANSLIPARDSRDPLTYTLNFYGDERFEMFCFLYHHGGYQDEKLETGKLTLLHKAILTEKEIVVLRCTNYMLQCGQDINAKEADGRSPIHIAAITGREDVMELLLAYEPNVFHYDNKGKTVFDYNENQRIAKLLENYVEFGPGDLEKALKQRDGKSNENIKHAEQFRKKRLGYTPS